MAKAPDYKSLYGMYWPVLMQPVEIERDCIRRGGEWKKKDGSTAGKGLFFHYRQLQTLLWPDDVHTRWSDLMLQTILERNITVVQGPKDSGKTHTLSKFALTDYLCFPDNTLIMISSTDIRGLEYRIWGDLKNLFQRARELYPAMRGHMIDSKHAICTQNLKEDEVRDMRKGIVCIPCVSSSGQWMGLGKYVGMKQGRRRLLGDELQFMKSSYLDTLANLNSGDFKGAFTGNPIGQGDPLDKMAEPKDGWGTEGEINKTATWANKFPDGITINLVGTDSPNFDQSQDPKPRYLFLISAKEIEKVSAFYGKDSVQYFSQALGVRKTGLEARRVITKRLCVQFGAQKECIWRDNKQTWVYAIDAAYGSLGGDRCVAGPIEFGKDVEGTDIVKVYPPSIVPVSAILTKLAEDQIAEWVKADCDNKGISPQNVFFDSTGRGSLGTSFARIWSPFVNPVEFGGNATERPVSSDFYIYDAELRTKRLKRCDEEYSKFVTELWFSVRYLIMGGQMRELPDDVMDEGCLREWKTVRGNKTEIETKAEMKERFGRSPDLFDWLCTAIEGARRMGFKIRRMANQESVIMNDGWKNLLRERHGKLRARQQLNYKA